MRCSKKLTTTFLTTLFAVALPCVTQAAPLISSASGTFAEGSTVTINGSGFGVSGPNVVLFDNFELGTVGAPLMTGVGSAVIGQWYSKTGTTYYTNTTKISGNQSFQADHASGWSHHGEVLLPVPTTEIFISWWKYIPAGDNWPGETTNSVNWKQMWIMRADSVDNDNWIPALQDGGTQWTLGGNNGQICGIGSCQRWLSNTTNVNQVKGKWHRNWIWMKGDPSQNYQGTLEYWTLREFGVHLSGWAYQANLLNSGGYWERLHMNAYGRQTPNSHPTFDDIYVATGPNARARIEIGNNSTYNGSTNLAISTPNSWSNNQITFTFRRGSFTAGQQAYLYVFDSNGVVNSQGFPFNVGGSGSASLSTPTNLTIIQ